MEKIALIFFIVQSVFLSCQTEEKNRVRITGGTTRLVSYTRIGNGAIELRRFEKNDTILGIGILLDVEAYSDTATFNLDHKNTYGPTDTIQGIIANYCNGRDSLIITQNLYNDAYKNKFKYSHTYGAREGSMSVHSDGEHLTTKVYQNLDEFMTKYNDRSMFTKLGRFEVSVMQQEFFFWIDNKELIKKIQKKGVISIMLYFQDRKVFLSGERDLPSPID